MNETVIKFGHTILRNENDNCVSKIICPYMYKIYYGLKM